MACLQTGAPLDLLGIDRVDVKHPDAQLQLRGHVVLLVLERASSRSLGLARAWVVSFFAHACVVSDQLDYHLFNIQSREQRFIT